MTQKLIKVGDSVAVIIPKKSLKGLGFKPGDRVKVDVDENNRRVTVESVTKEVDGEILTWTQKFIERYRPALEALADK
jgi:putative addiction module antidote